LPPPSSPSPSLRPPRVPVISNVTAEAHTTPDAIRRLLVQQVTASVLWEKSIRHLLAQAFNRFLELGPGAALTGFNKRIQKDAQTLNISNLSSLETTLSVV
jgi:[acyl-carrier-protein] S-malonyltransferase